MDFTEYPEDFEDNIPMPSQIHPKPFKNCTGCEEFGKDCHCLCHKEAIADGVHRIIYYSGE